MSDFKQVFNNIMVNIHFKIKKFLDNKKIHKDLEKKLKSIVSRKYDYFADTTHASHKLQNLQSMQCMQNRHVVFVILGSNLEIGEKMFRGKFLVFRENDILKRRLARYPTVIIHSSKLELPQLSVSDQLIETEQLGFIIGKSHRKFKFKSKSSTVIVGRYNTTQQFPNNRFYDICNSFSPITDIQSDVTVESPDEEEVIVVIMMEQIILPGMDDVGQGWISLSTIMKLK